ncbi:Thiol-disulfide isomerase or thioredoxin [Pseudoxanthomonas sp. GM95]|uniref:thioredoxin family protein n=1 Tax=Pseudoxanthomonas sp. GM95 TaxID=1881043 RepID=UPI0008AC6F0D|nr:thioredoxin family protein [Pseudoxanthomonas sp. GM95]SEM13849.1 Thiol-disulfide isomerase or thioredoxin [Pseudoxanthomonas sp. GM95]
MKRLLLPLLLLAVTGTALAAATGPYDPAADAKAQVKTALSAGKKDHKPTLLIFGANWCGDCRALDTSLHGEKNAALIAKRFEVVKVDVGNWDHNLDVANAYGNPIEKGIPAAVVVSPEGKIVYTTKLGELANARKMSDEGIYDFFSKAANGG